MVVEYHGFRPAPGDLAWVDPAYADPQVDQAARSTYGFTATGDVIVNDPASPSDAAVRHVYQRSQFEQIWLRTKRYRVNGTVAGGSGGIAYLIKPFWQPWPPGAGNW